MERERNRRQHMFTFGEIMTYIIHDNKFSNIQEVLFRQERGRHSEQLITDSVSAFLCLIAQ